MLLCLSSHNAGIWYIVRGEDITVGRWGGLVRVPVEERGLFWHPDTGGVPSHHHRGRVPAVRADAGHRRGEVRWSSGVGRMDHVSVLLSPHWPPGELQHAETCLGTVLLRAPGLRTKLALLKGADNATGYYQQTNHRDQDYQHETEIPLGIWKYFIRTIQFVKQVLPF